MAKRHLGMALAASLVATPMTAAYAGDADHSAPVAQATNGNTQDWGGGGNSQGQDQKQGQGQWQTDKSNSYSGAGASVMISNKPGAAAAVANGGNLPSVLGAGGYSGSDLSVCMNTDGKASRGFGVQALIVGASMSGDSEVHSGPVAPCIDQVQGGQAAIARIQAQGQVGVELAKDGGPFAYAAGAAIIPGFADAFAHAPMAVAPPPPPTAVRVAGSAIRRHVVHHCKCTK